MSPGITDSRVFGCKRLKPSLIERLWKDFHPIEQELVVKGSITSVACDDQLIVCGYTDGSCDVFSWDNKDYMTTLSDTQEDIHYSSSKILLGEDIIAKIAYGCDQAGRIGKCSIGIWMKTGFKSIFSTVLDSEKDCVYLQEHLNSVFIWEGKRLSKVVISQTSCEEIGICKAMVDIVKDMPKVDFQIDEMTFISKEKQNIYYYELECAKDINKLSMDTNIVDFVTRYPFVLVLEEFQFSVINLLTKEICSHSEICDKLISTSRNQYVVSILDAKNIVKIYTWRGLSNSALVHCLPIKSLNLPLPICSYGSPNIFLSDTGLVAGTAGSNRILCYQLWEGHQALKQDGKKVENQTENLGLASLLQRRNSLIQIRNL